MYYCLFAIALLLAASGVSAGRMQQQQQRVLPVDSEAELREIIDNSLKVIEKLEKLIEAQTGNSTEVVAKIVRKGYDMFTESTKVSRINNLSRQFYDRFVEIQMARLKVSPSDLEEVRKNLFQKLKEEEVGKWVAHKMLYNPSDSPNLTKYISVLGYVRQNTNFDLVVVDVTSAVQVAKDLLVIQSKDTGKLTIQKDETETERLPEDSGIEKSDVTLLLNFFQAIAVRALARVL